MMIKYSLSSLGTIHGNIPPNNPLHYDAEHTMFDADDLSSNEDMRYVPNDSLSSVSVCILFT
jgi:hypothetical protein